MRLAFLLLVLFVSQSAWGVEVTNFRSGLACTNTKIIDDGTGWICQPTEDVLVTDQGSCVYNGETEPCTWIGFEFDYRSAIKGVKLQCVSETSVPVDSGNPGEIIGKGMTSERYELVLEGNSGHFFNPQYFIFTTKASGKESLVTSGSCAADDVVVFKYVFNIRFPVLGKN